LTVTIEGSEFTDNDDIIITVFTPLKFQLLPGWNLIGMPVQSASTISEIFTPLLALSILGWNGSHLIRINADDNLDAGMGYWVYNPFTKIYASSTFTGSNLASPLTLGANQWRLIGAPGSIQLPDNQGIQTVISWNAARRRFLFQSVGAPLVGLQGYWVFTDSPTVVNFNK
jgi:hypothetical protein